MLVSLTIRNIALMDEMQVEFSSGLHALTGETGAGKSILVDAVTLLLGGRAQRNSSATARKRRGWRACSMFLTALWCKSCSKSRNWTRVTN
ncbi:MAG: AAA family ATPase [Clostridia bacterium]|nr:AAA family ATPase [Clostridia bacterium]